MINSALYYPNIEIYSDDAAQIKAMALLYDKIYRIVPDNIKPHDCDDIKGFLGGDLVVKNISPNKYKDSASKKFSKLTDKWGYTIISSISHDDSYFSRLHIDKISDSLKTLLYNMGVKEDDDFLNVPIGFLDSYMPFLAKEIAVKNNLQLSTKHWSPWTATTFFNLGDCLNKSPLPYNLNNSSDPFALYSLIISGIVPVNINTIPADRILAFRERRRDEIGNFRNAVFKLHNVLQNIEEPLIREDEIKRSIKEFEMEKKNYMESADIIKAEGWTGILFDRFTASASLARLFKIPFASSVVIGATGLAMGAIINIKATKAKLKKLNGENPASCIVALEKDFKKYKTQRGTMDISRHALNCINNND